MNLTTFIGSEKDSRCLMISWKRQLEINVTEKKGIRIITGSRSTYSTDFVLHDYAMYEYISYYFSLVFFYKTCIQ